MKIILHRVDDDGRTLDMTPDGQFRSPPPMPPSVLPWSARILRYAIVIAVLAAGLSMAALALWFALMLIPVAIGAALVAYGVFRWRVWKAGARYR